MGAVTLAETGTDGADATHRMTESFKPLAKDQIQHEFERMGQKAFLHCSSPSTPSRIVRQYPAKQRSDRAL